MWFIIIYDETGVDTKYRLLASRCYGPFTDKEAARVWRREHVARKSPRVEWDIIEYLGLEPHELDKK